MLELDDGVVVVVLDVVVVVDVVLGVELVVVVLGVELVVVVDAGGLVVVVVELGGSVVVVVEVVVELVVVLDEVVVEEAGSVVLVELGAGGRRGRDGGFGGGGAGWRGAVVVVVVVEEVLVEVVLDDELVLVEVLLDDVVAEDAVALRCSWRREWKRWRSWRWRRRSVRRDVEGALAVVEVVVVPAWRLVVVVTPARVVDRSARRRRCLRSSVAWRLADRWRRVVDGWVRRGVAAGRVVELGVLVDSARVGRSGWVV